MAHAVRFIDGHGVRPGLVQQPRHVRVHQSFGGREHEPHFTLADAVADDGAFRHRQAAVEPRGGNADAGQGIDLILHQRDERRHDDREAIANEGRRLVAERLPAAGGQDDE